MPVLRLLPATAASDLGRALRSLIALALLAWLAACTTTPPSPGSSGPAARSGRDGPPTQAGPDPLQVPDAEPRVEPIRIGGPNKPYEVLGQTYVPMTSDAPLVERGLASWYGRKFHGRRTASGETYNMHAMTAAHKTMPLPSYAKVINPANGREVIVRVNDRGPFAANRVIDLSWAAAVRLGVQNGVAPVEVQRLTFDEIRSGNWARGDSATVAQVTAAPAAAGPVAGAVAGGVAGGVAGARRKSASPVAPVPATPTASTQSPPSPQVAVSATASGATPAPSVVLAAAVGSATSATAGVPAAAPSGAGGSDLAGDPAASADKVAAAVVMPASPADASAPAAAPMPPGEKPPLQARARTSAGAGFWLQLGAFGRGEGAYQFQAQVSQELDWLAPLLTVFAEGGLHRLQAGPYASREQAREVAERLRAALQLVPVIVERR